ncbi:ead/Ea22-like family protein [Raoultella planticola]|uniref:ead/Ea22-like family protein n=1 Tax=Raoultella planticola TaxID=575 RepID=UPI001F5FF102|nr:MULTISPECIES: ead/Ea22-like family protein [Raoultella]
MTTDITELAQSLKAAAENAIGAHERLAAYPYGEVIDISQREGEQIDIDITDLNEFHEEASPANVIALVEALEKAKAQSSKWLEAYHKAVSIGARYEERIAELESRTVKIPGWFVKDAIAVYDRDEIEEALSAAGIKWEAE